MTFNFDNKKGKYICIRCTKDFMEVPKDKINECETSIQHYIVKKDKLKEIIIKRDNKMVKIK